MTAGGGAPSKLVMRVRFPSPAPPKSAGQAGIVTVGAITPTFHGVTAAVVALESHDEHFGIKVDLVPGVRTGLPYSDLPDQQHLTGWATDDLGNHYLAEQGRAAGTPVTTGAASRWGSGQPSTPGHTASTSCPPPQPPRGSQRWQLATLAITPRLAFR